MRHDLPAAWCSYAACSRLGSCSRMMQHTLNLSRLQYRTEKMRDGGAEESEEAGAAAGVGLWKAGADVPAPVPAALEAGRTNSRGFLAAPASGTTGASFSFPVFVLAVAVLLVGWPWGRVVCCWLVVLAGTEGCCPGAVAVTDLDAVGCRGAEKRRLYMAAAYAYMAAAYACWLRDSCDPDSTSYTTCRRTLR